MTKHTPGPWVVNHIDGDRFRIVDSKDMDILSHIATVHFHDDEEGETKANAALIAAAPELLDALKALTHSLEFDDLLHDDQRKAFNTALAAIAKAEGDAP